MKGWWGSLALQFLPPLHFLIESSQDCPHHSTSILSSIGMSAKDMEPLQGAYGFARPSAGGWEGHHYKHCIEQQSKCPI